jgi:hypothetical protein
MLARLSASRYGGWRLERLDTSEGRKIMPQLYTRLPPGLALGMEVVTNKRYAKAYRNSPPSRRGKITAGSSIKDNCYVWFEGRRHPDRLHRNFFDIVPEGANHEAKENAP